MRHERNRVIVRSSIHLERHGSNVSCQGSRNQNGARPRQLVSNDHPWAPVEEVRIGCAGSAALATSHRMRTDVARRRVKAPLRAQSIKDVSDDGVLHRRNVGDNRIGKALQRLDDDAVGDIRGCCNDNEPRS